MAKTKTMEEAYLDEQDALRLRAIAASRKQIEAANALPGLVDESTRKARGVLEANAAQALAQAAGAASNRALGGGLAGTLAQSAKSQGLDRAALEADALLKKNDATQQAAATEVENLKFIKEAGSRTGDIIKGKQEADAFMLALAPKYDSWDDFDGSGFRAAAEQYAATIMDPTVKAYALSRIHPIIASYD